MADAAAALAPLLAREQRRVVALLARQLGLASLALAEDAVQTAALRALERWPREGLPERPAAWLYRVAQHWALDQLRASGRHLPLLHGARLSGRIDARGDPIPLAGQPRERWDAGMIRLGLRHLQASQRGDRLSRWHLQAGIAAEHALAPTPAATRWPVIVRFYELLMALDPSQAPRLGHAVALAEARQAHEARALLQRLLPELPAALRAHGLAALGRAAECEGDAATAARCLHEAVACAPDAAQARLLQARAERLLRGAGPAAAPDRG